MTALPPPPSRYPGATSRDRNFQRVRLRQDTEENWLKDDPVLASGELAYTIGGGSVGSILKCGDGTRKWSELEYLASAGPSGPSGQQGAAGRSVKVYGPSEYPPAPSVELQAGDIWLSNGLYAQNPYFKESLIKPGADGPAGAASFFSPPVDSSIDLPAEGEPGQCVIALNTGHLWSWNVAESRWVDAGKIVGGNT